MTTSGSLSEYLLPTPVGYYSGAGRITVGPDGNLWFTWASWDPSQPLSATSGSIGRITPTGTITEFPVSSANGWPPGGITSGPDGDLWFTENGANAIGRISTTGVLDGRSRPDAEQRASRHRSRPGRQPLVHGSTIKQDRADLAGSARPPAPTVSSIAPLAGQVGTSVTIVGSNLTGATSVTFNGVTQPSFTVDGIGTVIMAAVPPGASTGPIRVTTPYGTATSPSSFAVVGPRSPCSKRHVVAPQASGRSWTCRRDRQVRRVLPEHEREDPAAWRASLADDRERPDRCHRFVHRSTAGPYGLVPGKGERSDAR